MDIYSDFDGQFLHETRPKFRKRKFYEINSESLDELMGIVYWAKSIKEAMRCFDTDVQEPPKCVGCSKHPGFNASLSGYPYRKFCVEDDCQYKRNRQSQTEEAREKYHNTCMTRYGYENPFKSTEWQEQNKQNFYEKHGVYNCMSLDSVKEKHRKTLLDRYDVDHIFKCEEIKEKRKQKWIHNYGVDNPSKADCVKEIIRQKWFERYDSEENFQKLREKVKKTYLKDWGEEHYLKSEAGLKHWRQKFSELYDGIDHPMHVPEIASKQGTTSGGFKNYTSNKGNLYKLQGYEHFAVELLEDLDIDFINERNDIGNIPYTMNNVGRKYYPDIYVPEYDLYIEVKSRYTYEGSIEKLKCIQDSNPEINLLVIIFNSNGSIDEII